MCVCVFVVDSCDGADRVTAFISIGGNKEKIDDFCGSGTPRELMSNSAAMSLHFHSTAVSKGARGFKARYSFVSSKFHYTGRMKSLIDRLLNPRLSFGQQISG